jgi:hypothetical protein
MKIEIDEHNYYMGSGFVVLSSIVSAVFLYHILVNGIVEGRLTVTIGLVPFTTLAIAALIVCIKELKKPILIINTNTVSIRSFLHRHREFQVIHTSLELSINDIKLVDSEGSVPLHRRLIIKRAWDEGTAQLAKLNFKRITFV